MLHTFVLQSTNTKIIFAFKLPFKILYHTSVNKQNQIYLNEHEHHKMCTDDIRALHNNKKSLSNWYRISIAV